jgi:hypothetical protein
VCCRACAEAKLHSIKKEKLEPLEGDERTKEGLQAFTDAGSLLSRRHVADWRYC